MKIKTILTIFFLIIIYMYIANITQIPDEIIILRNEDLKFKTMPGISIIETMRTFSLDKETKVDTSIEIQAFGKISC